MKKVEQFQLSALEMKIMRHFKLHKFIVERNVLEKID